MTSISARCRSVSTEKVRLTLAKPREAEEIIFSSPGTPRSMSSCGSMISDSTSSGAAARQPVVIWMNGRCTSGIIWIGRRPSDTAPSNRTRSIAAMTATGFDRDSFVRFTLAPDSQAAVLRRRL